MKETTRLGLGVLEAALLLGLLGDALLRVGPWGVNVPLWVGVLAAATVALVRQKRLRLGGEGRWLLPCALAFAAAFAWRDSPTLKLLDAFALLALLALALLRAHRGRVRLAGLTEYALAGLVAMLSAAFGPLLLLFQDIGWKEIPRDGWKRHAFAALRGLVIAVPLVLVFGGLFVAADAVYEGLVRRTFNFDSGVVVSHVAVFIFFAWVSAGYLRGAFLGKEPASPGLGFPARIALGLDGTRRDGAADERPKANGTIFDGGEAATATADESVESDAREAAQTARRGVSLGIVEIGVVLGLLNALFFSFVAVQLRYFFGGAKVVLTSAGLTYAEYARRGFFELVWVAALVLPMLLVAHWLLRKEYPAHERVFRGLAAGLLLMLFVIMTSAVGRMRLYQSEYGQTELRLYTTAFMGWLFVVFVWFALTVLRGSRERFACGALVAALSILCALHVLNPDDLIMRTNASLVRRGRPLDACYALGLSADAAPALLGILPELDAGERSLLARDLLRRWPDGGADWRTWNWSRARAREAVAGREVMLREMGLAPPTQNCLREDEW
jgi:hypothetical protein